jgi:hypothetical protein
MTDHQVRWRPEPAEFSGPDERGHWQASGTTGQFEVICSTCGDEGGPVGQLPSDLQGLRGPYRSVELVREAVLVHRFASEP